MIIKHTELRTAPPPRSRNLLLLWWIVHNIKRNITVLGVITRSSGISARVNTNPSLESYPLLVAFVMWDQKKLAPRSLVQKQISSD